MEVIEHVSNINMFIKLCNYFLKKNGDLIISTLNKSICVYIYMILLGEYITNFIPKKTHSYKYFIRPNKLNRILKKYNFNIKNIHGIKYNSFLKHSFISNNLNNNYILHAKKQ